MRRNPFVTELEEFYKYFKDELKLTNKSKNTIISYNTTITSFIAFVKEYEKKLSFDNLKKIDIMKFLEYKNLHLEKQSELKASSKKLYVTHLKTFFTFINENMDKEIKISSIFRLNIKTPMRTPKGIEENDVKKLEDYLNSIPCDNFLNAKKRLMAKTYLYSGARKSELQIIKIKDFVEDDDIYVVETIGKGDKERVLFIPKIYIEEELSFYKRNRIKYVAETKSGKIMDESQIYRFLNNIYKRAGIHYTGVHILRHTFAKKMTAEGERIETVQKFLAHTNIQTTMIYTEQNQKETKKAYKEAFRRRLLNCEPPNVKR